MSLVGFLLLLIIAAVCGSIGQALVGYSRGGLLLSIFFGFVGAYFGMWLARELGWPEWFAVNIEGQPFPIIWSIIGAALVAAFFSLLSGRRGRRVL